MQSWKSLGAVLAGLVLASSAFAQPNTPNTQRRNPGNVAAPAQGAPANQPVTRRNTPGGVAGRPGEVGPLAPRAENPRIDNGIGEATDFTIPGYTTTHVSLRWWNNGAPRTQIFRQISGGPWTLLQTYGPLPTGQYADFLDQSATINAENCYRISVSDGVNSFSTKTTPIRCALTRDGRNIPVHRLQLRIMIASAANAGTDNTIEVRLQTPVANSAGTVFRPAGNSTWVDSTANDFERFTNRTYDLMLSNISQASDITVITLAKPGDDDVCIAALELLVDGASAFSRSYGNDAGTCQKIQNDTVLSVHFDELRANYAWTHLSPNTFTGFDGAGLRAVIEAKFGHFLHGHGELRSGQVTTLRVSEDRLRVAVPITVYGVPVLGDVDSTVHFDMVLTNANGQAQLSFQNVDADSSDLASLISPLISGLILTGVSDEIEAQISGIAPTNVPGASLAGTHTCFTPDAGLGVCFDH